MFLRRPTFLLRFAVCLLALLQGVAVSWHVCELGGPQHGGAHCQPAVQSADGPGAVHCPPNDDPTRLWRMRLEQTAPDAGDSHCLAALLATTPAQTTQTFVLSAVFTAAPLPRATVTPHLCDAVTFGSGPRGPPVLS